MNILYTSLAKLDWLVDTLIYWQIIDSLSKGHSFTLYCHLIIITFPNYLKHFPNLSPISDLTMRFMTRMEIFYRTWLLTVIKLLCEACRLLLTTCISYTTHRKKGDYHFTQSISKCGWHSCQTFHYWALIFMFIYVKCFVLINVCRESHFFRN